MKYTLALYVLTAVLTIIPQEYMPHMDAFLYTYNQLIEEGTLSPAPLNLPSDTADKADLENEEAQATAADFSLAKAVDEVESVPFFAIAQVNDYVNVRKEPNTESEIVGKLYNGAVAEVHAAAGTEGDWFQIISGSVTGYVKAEYFLSGEDAEAVIADYLTTYALIQADRLNVREEASTAAKRIGYLECDEKVVVTEDLGDWLQIRYTSTETGYIAKEYAQLSEEYSYALTTEEEQTQAATEKARISRMQTSETSKPENTAIEFPATTYTSNEELRQSIVDYAMQFLGNKYVNGGNSLENGTDCSGFTMLIYAEFGYSISRTPAGQLSSAGRSIDYSEIQPGDIICYSSNGSTCTHVALYIGDGQIIHAANSRKGVVIYEADYDTIIGIKNVID